MNSIKKIYTTTICLLFFIVTLYAQDEKNILIVNSYDNSVAWTKEASDTVSHKIQQQSQTVKVTICHLSANENNSTESMERLFLRAFSEIRPQPVVIVTLGDAARIVYNRIKDSLPIHCPVIAAGVSELTASHLEIAYPFPVKENIELIEKCVPGLSEIIWISNDTYQNALAKKALEKYLAEHKHAIRVIPVSNNQSGSRLLYKYVLENTPGRAVLSDGWTPDSKYSSYTAFELDSILTHGNIAPVFNSAGETYPNNYIVGGYVLSARICGEKIVDQINKLLNGTKPAAIPSEIVKNGDYILNKQAVKRFNLGKAANSFYDVKYINTGTSFFGRLLDGKTLLGLGLILGCILLAICIGILSFIINIRYIRKLHRTSIQFDKLNNLLQRANINFAIYDQEGIKQTENIHPGNTAAKTNLPENLFEASFLTAEDIADVKRKKSIKYTLNTGYDFIVRPVADNTNKFHKYIAMSYLSSNLLNMNQKRENTLDEILDFALKHTTLAIASYNIRTGEGYASDSWFANIGEHRRSDQLIRPAYINYPIEDSVATTEFMQRLQNGEIAEFSRDIKLNTDNDKEEKWIRNMIFVQDVDSKNGINVIDLNFDISPDKIKETKLRSFIKQAENYGEDINSFMNAISHEIRTPLTSIVGFSKTLTSNATKEEKVEIINIIKRNNELLINLINNILVLSNINSGAYKFKQVKVDLNEFFNDLKIATEHMLSSENVLNDKNIKIVLKIPKTSHSIITDDWMFRQVMINLLSNAVKFTESGSITLGYQTQYKEVYFYVKDTGSGIAPENHEKIFNPFERIDGFTQGCGLGLALSKSIVFHLGGKIDVISGLEEGSLFWFTLPDK